MSSGGCQISLFLSLTYRENHILIKIFMFLGVVLQPSMYFVLSLKAFVGFSTYFLRYK